nr:sodium channel nonvoltage gated 1 alpha [Hymenolepis microstoma]
MPRQIQYDQTTNEETPTRSFANNKTLVSSSTISNTSSVTFDYRRNDSSLSDTFPTLVEDSNQNRGPTYSSSDASSSGKLNLNTFRDAETVTQTDNATESETNRNNLRGEHGKRKPRFKFDLREWFRRKQDPEMSMLSREEKDALKYERVKKKLIVWTDRTTFHGVDVLAETPAGWKKILVFLLLALMCVLCWICVFKMVFIFLNRPINTVIVKDASEFRFPAITVCPDSPFSMAQLTESGVLDKFTGFAQNWTQLAPNTTSPDHSRFPQFEGDWRQRTKYSFFPIYATTPGLQVKWGEYFVACQFNGKACSELHKNSSDEGQLLVGTGDGYTGKNVSSNSGIYLGYAHWTLDPGRIYGYVNTSLDITREYLMASLKRPRPIKWPRSPVVITDSAKYQCFQIRMDMINVKRAGSGGGLHLVFRRPYSRMKTLPALLHVDADASLYQGWTDYTGSISDEDASLVSEMDGMQILLHDVAKNDMSVISGRDLPSTGDARSVVRTSVRYGQQIVVTLSQFIHERLDSYYHPCKESIPPIVYLDVGEFMKSQKRKAITVTYSTSNCIAALRSSVIQRWCGCVSEASMVPLFLADSLATQGFCHNLSRPNISDTVACHDKVMRLSDEEIMDVSIPKRWYRVMLLAINLQTKRLWLCPSPCRERVNEVSYQRTLSLVEDLPLEILKNIPKPPNSTQFNETIASNDYLVISIAAETSRISVHSEGEPTSFFNLLAAIGGLFGLYLGLSLVTVFECIESYYIFLSEGFGTFRHAFKLWNRFRRKLLTREKSPEYDEEDEAVANRIISSTKQHHAVEESRRENQTITESHNSALRNALRSNVRKSSPENTLGTALVTEPPSRGMTLTAAKEINSETSPVQEVRKRNGLTPYTEQGASTHDWDVRLQRATENLQAYLNQHNACSATSCDSMISSTMLSRSYNYPTYTDGRTYSPYTGPTTDYNSPTNKEETSYSSYTLVQRRRNDRNVSTDSLTSSITYAESSPTQ